MTLARPRMRPVPGPLHDSLRAFILRPSNRLGRGWAVIALAKALMREGAAK